MSAAANPTSPQRQPTPARTYIVRGLAFLAVALCSLAVESVARKSVSDHGPFVMQGVYWLLVAAQTFFGTVLVLVVPPYFLLSEALPWWLRRFDPEQWKVWQEKIAAGGGPASRWLLFTFGCFFIGGLAMLLPIGRVLFGAESRHTVQSHAKAGPDGEID